jgi:hypothetical protein
MSGVAPDIDELKDRNNFDNMYNESYYRCITIAAGREQPATPAFFYILQKTSNDGDDPVTFMYLIEKGAAGAANKLIRCEYIGIDMNMLYITGTVVDATTTVTQIHGTLRRPIQYKIVYFAHNKKDDPTTILPTFNNLLEAGASYTPAIIDADNNPNYQIYRGANTQQYISIDPGNMECYAFVPRISILNWLSDVILPTISPLSQLVAACSTIPYNVTPAAYTTIYKTVTIKFGADKLHGTYLTTADDSTDTSTTTYIDIPYSKFRFNNKCELSMKFNAASSTYTYSDAAIPIDATLKYDRDNALTGTVVDMYYQRLMHSYLIDKLPTDAADCADTKWDHDIDITDVNKLLVHGIYANIQRYYANTYASHVRAYTNALQKLLLLLNNPNPDYNTFTRFRLATELERFAALSINDSFQQELTQLPIIPFNYYYAEYCVIRNFASNSNNWSYSGTDGSLAKFIAAFEAAALQQAGGGQQHGGAIDAAKLQDFKTQIKTLLKITDDAKYNNLAPNIDHNNIDKLFTTHKSIISYLIRNLRFIHQSMNKIITQHKYYTNKFDKVPNPNDGTAVIDQTCFHNITPDAYILADNVTSPNVFEVVIGMLKIMAGFDAAAASAAGAAGAAGAAAPAAKGKDETYEAFKLNKYMSNVGMTAAETAKMKELMAKKYVHLTTEVAILDWCCTAVEYVLTRTNLVEVTYVMALLVNLRIRFAQLPNGSIINLYIITANLTRESAAAAPPPSP